MQHKHYTCRALPLFAALALLSGGCASFDLSKRIPWGAGEDGKPAAPMRLMAVWTDTTMTSPGKPAMRGMGGRIVFYDQANEPVKVKGTLVVYAFDETNRDPTNVTPDRKYVFLPADFEKHYSKGRLGHSYSFWLPWDQVGGKQAAISLIARFQPDKGGEIIGEQTKHLLPGLAAELPPIQWGGAAPQNGNQPPRAMPAMNGTTTPGMLPPGQMLPQQQQLTPVQRLLVPQETAQNGWNQQGVQQASALMPINGAAAAGPEMADPNVPSKIKSFTIPLRNSNSILVRPMDQLRAMEQQNPEQAKKMLEQQQALFSQDGTASPAAFQAQQTYLMQQAMAQRMAQEMPLPQGTPAANSTTTEANGVATTVGNTPLSGRTGSHFQQRQSKPLWGDKSAVMGPGQGGQTAATAPQESSADSPPSRRQVLGGTISRLGPAHAR
jgi:hypothetical protein